MRYFNDDRQHPSYRMTGAQLTALMTAAYEAGYQRALLGANHKGPATRAKRMAKRWKKGKRPTWAPERANRFVTDKVTDLGYGAHKQKGLAGRKENAYMEFGMQEAIKQQDEARKNRLMSEMMHRACCQTNFNEFDTDLSLPGPAESTEIVSCAGTRALGFAPQISAPAMIRLDCKYEMGEKQDMAIELD